MGYVFHNLSDDKLEELSSAVHEERKRRFLLTAPQYPKLSLSLSGKGNYVVEGIEAYRAAYGIGISHAHTLFHHYHRRIP